MEANIADPDSERIVTDAYSQTFIYSRITTCIQKRDQLLQSYECVKAAKIRSRLPNFWKQSGWVVTFHHLRRVTQPACWAPLCHLCSDGACCPVIALDPALSERRGAPLGLVGASVKNHSDWTANGLQSLTTVSLSCKEKRELWMTASNYSHQD